MKKLHENNENSIGLKLTKLKKNELQIPPTILSLKHLSKINSNIPPKLKKHHHNFFIIKKQ